MSRERGPSPWLFALALPLGLGAGALLLWRADGAERVHADQFFDTARLARLEAPGPLRVVALGSSMVSHALVFDGELEAMGAAAGRPVRFVRFSRNGRSLDAVPALLARLAERPPDLLVTEAEWLAWGEPAPSFRRALKYRRRRVFLALRVAVARLCGHAPDLGPGREDNRPGTPAQPEAPAPFDPGRYRELLDLLEPQDPRRLEPVLAGLARLRARGCRVVVLAFGRSPGAAAMFPADQARTFSGASARLAARGLPVADAACPLPQDCYLDHAHLNRRGRERFSAWFLTRLGAWSGRP